VARGTHSAAKRAGRKAADLAAAGSVTATSADHPGQAGNTLIVFLANTGEEEDK